MGCRTRRPQADLVRVGCDPEGMAQISRTLPGRGAWLCQGSIECFDAAVQRRAFARALKADVAEESLERLRTDFAPPSAAARD